MLFVIWTTAAYNYDQSMHEQIVAEASAQCADLDEKPEEYECRRSWPGAEERGGVRLVGDCRRRVRNKERPGRDQKGAAPPSL